MNVDFGAFFQKASGAAKATPSADAAREPQKRKRDKSPGPAPAAAKVPASQGSESKKKKKKKTGAGGGTDAADVASSSAAASRAPSQAGPSSSAPRKQSASMAKIKEQLLGARFRDINEQLYTQDSAHAVQLFGEQPELYHAYHEGFRVQARGWPLRPVDAIVAWLAKQPQSWLVADIGCGDAEISERVRQKVHCFDLVAGRLVGRAR